MTQVPSVTFGSTGFVQPPESAVLAGVQADINAAFGGNLNYALTTPQGQLATTEAAVISETDANFCYLTNQFDPAYAQGRYQDALGRIYFLSRNPAEPTVLQVVCSGGLNVSIPVGALIRDDNGNVYSCTAAGSIPSSGNITLPFANLTPGPVSVPETVTIYQAIPGWDSVSVSSGVPGSNVESRSQFEVRRAASVAQNAVGSLPAVQGAVLSVSGVLDCYVYENPTGSPITTLGVTLPAHSLYVAVVGGNDNDVAQAIWSKKAPGCAYYSGNTSVTVYDTNGYLQPYPSYTVTYEIPASLPFVFAVSIENSSLVPADATTQIQNAIVNALAGGDGGPRAKIGSLVLSLRFYAPIAALGSWAQVESIQINDTDGAAAGFTGSISGTTLSTSGVTGTIAIGQSVMDLSGNVTPGTVITAGSGSSWTVNISQTVGSETMYGVVPNQNTVQVNINKSPTLQPGNILVTLV